MSSFKQMALLQEAARRAAALEKTTLQIHSTEGDVSRAEQVLRHLHPAQLHFIKSPSTMKTALCTRRAGKTTGVAAGMLYTILRFNNCEVGYFAPTAKDARGVMRKQLMALHKQYNIHADWHEQRAEFAYPNGSIITLVGANDASGLIRGLGRAFHLIVIDEAASFGQHFESLIIDTLLPTLADYDGSMWMVGTPQPVCYGYFHDVTTGKIQGDWDRHVWSVLDNPYLPVFVKWREKNPGKDWQEYARGEWLDSVLRKAGLKRDDPSVLRMWFGKWVRDGASLVYNYDPNKNALKEMPDNVEWRMVMGVDFGAMSAIVVIAYSPDLPFCVVLKSERLNIRLTDEIGEKIKAYRRQFRRISKVVVDCGNLGKQIAEDLRSRHNLPIIAAEKRYKTSYQTTMCSDFSTGRIQVVEANCAGLIGCWNSVQKDPTTGEELDGMDNHESDAALYAWRFCRHFFSKEQVEELNANNPDDWEIMIESQLLQRNRKQDTVVQDELEGLYA